MRVWGPKKLLNSAKEKSKRGGSVGRIGRIEEARGGTWGTGDGLGGQGQNCWKETLSAGMAVLLLLLLLLLDLDG